MSFPNILVVSPYLDFQQAFAIVLGKFGLAPIIASTAGEAEEILDRHPVSLVFCSDELPNGGVDGLIAQNAHTTKRAPMVVVSRLDDWGRFLSYLQRGAFDYVLYPLDGNDVERVVKNAISSVSPNTAQQAAAARTGKLDRGTDTCALDFGPGRDLKRTA
jgi:DNA-binding NtrC family response regulator